MTTRLTHIQTKDTSFVPEYPEAIEMMKGQQETFWIFDETNPEKDKHCLMVEMTPAERHGVITVLKTFTLMEKIIGEDFWLNYVCKQFPREADIIPMAMFYSAVEMGCHMPFYRLINEEMNLSTYEFYDEYLHDPAMSGRIDSMMETLAHKDPLRTIGGFTFFEGAILFSSFAFLKGFQSNGQDKIVNIVSGINFTCRDEMRHCDTAAWLYKTLKEQQLNAGIIDEDFVKELELDIIKAGHDVYEHELLLLDKIFEEGEIEGISKDEIAAFVRHRVNYCLQQLDIDPIFDESYNPIAKTFYASITGYSSTDFFSSQSNQYSRGWNKQSFSVAGKGDYE